LALAASAIANERVPPLPYYNYLTFAAGEVCEFPLEFSADGAVIATHGQAVYLVEDSAVTLHQKGLWLLLGTWSATVDEFGDPAAPLAGKGRKVDLCRELR
jgi:hypothetical protein